MDKLTTSDKTKVQAARDAYDALSDEQKGYITMADVAKYNAAVEWLEQQGVSTGGSITKNPDEEAASEVISLISAIGTVTADSGEAIRTAREAYDALTDAQKALVSNYDVLTAAEAAYAALSGDQPFQDVSTEQWFYEAVQYVYDAGLMNGVSETAFAPDATLSRGMVATVLYRLAGEPASTGESPAFPDVTSDAWFAQAVAWAAEHEVVNGYDDGSFYPDGDITREELAVMLWRYAKAAGMDTGITGDLSAFSDASAVSGWAVEALTWCVEQGILTGRDNGILDPGGTATRAEAAAILMRYAQN